MKVELEQDGDGATLEMAPLIDIVFLLLIFFLVATTMKKPEPELNIDLPPPAITAGEAQSVELVRVAIPRAVGSDTAGGYHYYYNKEPVTQGELRDRLHVLAQTAPNQRVRIDADRYAPTWRLVHVLDLLNFEGLRNYGIHTRPSKTFLD